MRPFGGAPTRELKLVWVEQGGFNHAIRIFRSQKAAFAAQVMTVQMCRDVAVSDIRHQIFRRSKGSCEGCSSPITESSGHMHERQHRGRGGEISLDNSVFICAKCHQYAHRDRNPRWGEEIQ